jgi:RNA polymerase sigma factor (sigma-70 family)
MSAPLSPLLEHIGGMVSAHSGPSATDAELLSGFSSGRDKGAFTALVQRHGPMVLRVCRRVLHHEQDAEDAFQATFLVLARCAAAVRKREALASWLHGVACRMAANARRAAARRRAHERCAETAAGSGPNEQLAWREVQSILDEEVQRLPEKYRAVFVPCCLEGESRVDVAHQLGQKEGTVSSRLATARKLLRARLARRGITLSAVMTVLALTQGAGRGSVPAVLSRSTVRAAGAVARSTATGVSERVLALVGGGDGRWSYLKLGALCTTLLAAALVVGAGALADPPQPVEGSRPERARVGTDPASGARPQKPGRTDRHGDPLPEGAVARIGTLRFRHGGGHVNRVLPTADGTALVTQSYYGEGSVFVWDLATGRMLHQFPGHYEENGAVALSPDGKTLARGQGGVIHLHDLGSGKEVRKLMSPLDDTQGLAFSPDGTVLASGHANTTVLLWDLADGKVRAKFAAEHNRTARLVFSPDGKTLATGDTLDSLIRLFDVATSKERHQIRCKSFAHDFAFSPDSATLAVGAQDGAVSLWSSATGKLVEELEAPNKHVRSVAWAPDGKTLATGDLNPEKQVVAIRVWDPATGKELRQMQMTGIWGMAQSLAFTADGKTLISGGGDGVIRLWDPATGLEKSPVAGLPGGVWHIAVSPDGKTLAYPAHGIALWDLSAGREIGTLPGHHWSFAFSPDSKTLAGGSDTSALNVWDVPGQRLLRRLELDKQKERLKWATFDRCAFSPDGKVLVTGGREAGEETFGAGIRWWDPATGRELRQVTFKNEELFTVECVAFSPDGKVLVTSGRAIKRDGAVRVLDATSGEARTRLQGTLNTALGKVEELPHGQRILEPRVAFSPDGRLLAMNRSEPTVPVWEMATGRVRCQLKGHDGPTTAVAFSADGRTLASAGSDNTIRVWDVETARELKRFKGHRGGVSALAFTPDGRALISGGDDTTLLFWDVLELTQRSRAAVHLTPTEWDALWATLAGSDAGKSHAALAQLVAAPEATVLALRKRLRPAPAPDAARLAQLVRELGAEEFATRERASEELARLGELAEPALKRARTDPSPEVVRRCNELLTKLTVPSGDQLRELRAVEALERIGTPDARAVLEALARGALEARVTGDAKAALDRLSTPTRKR